MTENNIETTIIERSVGSINIMKNGVDIASIDAKDIYLASHYINNTGGEYTLKLKNGQYNLRRFINSLDYSLDLIELMDVYYRKFRRRDFAFKIRKHLYSVHVINLTFKYSVKEWNQMNKNTFVKFGYDYRDLTFDDGVALNDSGEIVGIQVGKQIDNHSPSLPPYFECVECEDSHIEYRKIKEFPTIMTSAQLREDLYKNGFICDGVKYCRFKRSAGSARVGKCLFINELLYKPMLKFSSGGISLKDGQEVDLAGYESYISLTSSSIIDTLEIKPENILLIDDYESVFNEDVIETKDENGLLVTKEGSCEISNSIWDGQSLLDISLFGDYEQYGMVLLRNLMFKSCCFNTNIQQWFKDNNITSISQLNGRTIARRIEDIKLITTPSSIKYLKFGTFEDWLQHLYPRFGVVKHDKKTHFFDGRMVQTHYQLINTLQLSKDEVAEFLEPSLDFAQKLRDNPAVVRYYIKYPDINEMEPLSEPMLSKNDVVYNLMCVNDNFTKTKYYQEFLHDLLKSYYKNLKNGHVYVNGNYSTLFGNPIEMLQQSIGKFEGFSQIGVGNVHSTRFEYNKLLLGSRSPHVTMANIWLPYNTENKLIDCYFNLTDEIVCVNSIGENVLQRLSGADFDSDTALLTDNEVLIRAAKRNYKIFKVATSSVSAKKVKRYYTAEQQVELDIKTSENKIGEIINLSQELNSLLWDRIYYGASYNDVRDLYFDICQLDVMSGIEIDKAKKEFDINNTKELDLLRQKYAPELKIEYEDGTTKKKMPHFFAHVSRQKGYYNPDKKNYCKYHTSMDYLQTIVNGYRVKTPMKKDWLPFAAVLDNGTFRASNVNQKQINKIYSIIKSYQSSLKKIFQSDSPPEEKHMQYKLLKDRLISEIDSESIGNSTMYVLLRSLEDKDNRSIKNVLLECLWLCGNESFKRNILDSATQIDTLIEGGDDIKLFNFGFKINKNSQILS